MSFLCYDYETEKIEYSESGGIVMQEKSNNDIVREVHSQIATEVNELYEYFRKKQGLEEESDTERQLEILTAKKYISHTYQDNLEYMIKCYESGRIGRYLTTLEEFKIRIRYFLDSYA